MTVRILIKRAVPEDKKDVLAPLLIKLRNMALSQPGYVSGETLHRIDEPGSTLVISTWLSMDEWRKWVANDDRKAIQKQIDDLLGKETEYEAYRFG